VALDYSAGASQGKINFIPKNQLLKLIFKRIKGLRSPLRVSSQTQDIVVGDLPGSGLETAAIDPISGGERP